MGVKDWAPSRIPTVLTDEQHKSLSEIKSRYERSSPDQAAKDVSWLCDALECVARLRPDEFAFPQYTALINPVACTAIALRLLGKERILKTAVIPETRIVAFDLLDKEIACEVCDAVMVVRPYIRLHRETKPGIVEEFRQTVFSFVADGQTLINKASVDEVLVLPNGTGVRRLPWSFPESLPNPIFPAGALDEQQQATRDVRNGFMAVNQTRIEMKLDPTEIKLSEPVHVVSGLVAARYTTKAQS